MIFLDKVQLAYSCPLAWENLVGGERRRFCGECQKHVTNLSAMSRPAASAWLARNEGVSVCVRVEVDETGRSLHRPAPAAFALAALALGAAGCATDEDTSFDSGNRGPAEVVTADNRANAANEEALTLHTEAGGVHQLLGEPPPVAVMGGISPVRPMVGRVAPSPDGE